MSGTVRLLRRPLVRASSTATPPAAVALPSPHDLGAFHAKLDRMGAPARARELAALQAGASALAREQDTLGTLPRQLAHMLLVRPVLRPADLLNPATAWADTEPTDAEVHAAEEAEAAAGEGAAGAADAAATAAARAAEEEEALRAFEGSAHGGAAAAARAQAPLAQGSGASAPARGEGGEDASPPIGGALSYVSAGEIVPGPGPGFGAEPNPVALLYIDALREFLGGSVLPRLQRRAAAAAAGANGGASSGSAAPRTSPERLEKLLAAMEPGAAPLEPALAAWLAGQPPAAAAALAAELAQQRLGGAPAHAARAAAVAEACRVLGEARAGTLGSRQPPALPSARALHDALAAAAAAAAAASPALADFTLRHSAAAATAQASIARLHAAAASLSECAAHTLRAKAHVEKVAQGELPQDAPMAGAGSSGASSSSAPAYTLAGPAPTVAAVLALPGLELPTLALAEAPSGVTHQLALGPAGGGHAQRLAAGHVPSMLSPLLRLLTPSEWGACLALVRVSLPDASPYLLPPVRLPPAAEAAAAPARALGSGSGRGGGGGGGGAPGAPAAAGAAAAASLALASEIVGEYGVATAVAGGGSMLNATGLPNSALNALLPAAAGEPGDVGAARAPFAPPPPHAVAAAAPTPGARDEYLRYLLRARGARVLLVDTRGSLAAGAARLEAMAAAATAKGDAGEAEGVAALRAEYHALCGALERGERVGDEGEALRALRLAEMAAAPLGGDLVSTRLLGTFKAAAPAPGGEGAVEGGIGALSRAMAAGAPALVGPEAARRAAPPPGPSGRVWWGAGMADDEAACAAGGGGDDGGSARLSHPAPEALGSGGLRPFPSTATYAPPAPGAPPAPHPADVPGIHSLGAEDSGGLLAPAAAEEAQAALEVGIWPPVPRLLPWDLAWASRRAAAGFPKDSASGLEGRNAAVRGEAPLGLPSAGGGAGGEGSQEEESGQLATTVSPLDPALAGPQPSLQARRLASAARSLSAAQRLSAGGEAAASVVEEDWTSLTYGPAAGYRDASAHTLAHARLLEAAGARDLGAVWALWSEHCRLNPQGGAPDILALEIVMDCAARARRPDLLHHVLWPRVMALRVVPTAAMWLILLKSAALEGEAGRAVELLETLAREGLAHLDARHYAAAVSACLGSGAFEEAFRLFNRMRRAHLQPPASLFEAFFVHLGAAGRWADCAHVWRALLAAPTLAVPPALYTRIVVAFARCGDLAAMEAALKRMGRSVDGGQRPSAPALCAVFDAYAAAGDAPKAAQALARMEASGLCSASDIESRRNRAAKAAQREQREREKRERLQ